MGLLGVLILVFLYGAVLLRPLLVSQQRRDIGLPTYWLAVLMTYVLQALILISIFEVSKVFDQLGTGIFVAPVLSLISGGKAYFYFVYIFENRNAK